jgi:integrase
MASKKFSTQFPGVRYRVHKCRKYSGGNLDRYFSIRYRVNGKLKEEGIGWASEGWNAQKVSIILSGLKKAHLTGKGPQTLGEQRAFEYEKREQERLEKERIKRETLSFSDYFRERYFPEAKVNKGWRSYQREDSLHRLWIEPVIGKMPFKDIRPFHLERIKKNLTNAGRSARSIQYAFAVVRQVFNHAIKNEIFFGESPTKKVTRPKVDNKRERFLKQEEAQLLMENLKTRSQKLYEIACISLHCGLRAGEIFKLTWGCIDCNEKTIRIMDSKGGLNRTAHMTETVRKIFLSKEKAAPTSLVFKDRKGGMIKEVSNAFGRAVKDLGFNNGIDDPRQKVYFHTLRHTFASWIVQSGENLYTVKELLGHSTMAMTERYSHLASKNLKNAVKKLEDSMKTADKEKETEPEAVEMD